MTGALEDKQSFTPQLFVICNDDLEKALHKPGERGFIKTGLRATEKTIDALRFVIWCAESRVSKTALSSMNINWPNTMASIVENDNQANSATLRVTPSGEIVISLTRVSNWGHSGKLIDGDSEKTLNAFADHINKFLLARIWTDRKDATLKEWTDETVLQTAMKDSFGCFSSVWKGSCSYKKLEEDPRCQIRFSPKEVNCIYEILKGHNGKKLSEKYGEVYEQFAIKDGNPMDAEIINGFAVKMMAMKNDIKQRLDENEKLFRLRLEEAEAEIKKAWYQQRMQVLTSYEKIAADTNNSMLAALVRVEIDAYKNFA